MYNPIKTKSTSIASRERTFRVVNAALDTHTGEATEILNDHFAPDPVVDGQAVTNYRTVFADLGSELRKARQTMLSANTTHLGQLALIVDLRKQRDGLQEVLFDRYFKARHTIETLYGKSQGFELLAVSGETPRDPTGLVNQVRETVEFLHEPKVEVSAPDLDGVQIDLSTIATQLGSGADELDTALVAIDRERKNGQTTRKAKNDAIAEFDRRYLWVGRALETYFNLAGMFELAERVRPSTRRPGRRAVDEKPEQGSGEAQVEEETQEAPAETPVSESSDA
ncbi:MAG: hypothetical protein GY719_14865 [bacterium]|nr:hypothetical protein [bacterium]